MSKYLDCYEVIRELIIDELLGKKEWAPHFQSALSCFEECRIPLFSPGGSLQRRITVFVAEILAGEAPTTDLGPDHQAKVREALSPFLEEGRRRLAERGFQA